MVERLSDRLREFLKTCEGRDVSLKYLRDELKIDPNSPAWNGLRQYMGQLSNEKIVKPSGRNDGVYKVVRQVKPVSVFGRERRPPIVLCFPKDVDSGYELSFADDLIIREGDLILISGMSNYGKTALCINFAGENIHLKPVLMGNEYTTIDDEPSPRFLNRLDAMDWVKWGDENGDNFTLLPVHADYAEHIVKDKINIIDWINIDTGEHYMIGSICESIKRELGKGIAIIAIQKAEGAESGRGGQFTKDFSDVEILLDKFPESPLGEVLLTIGKVKESKKRVSGRTFAYGIAQGVKIINFREVIKCKDCFGKGWKVGKPCETCDKSGYVNKDS